RLGSSLALMLAAPGVNVAALALTFTLLPLHVAVARTASALLIVFGLSTLVGWVFEDSTIGSLDRSVNIDEMGPISWAGFVVGFGRSLVYLPVVTVPLILTGVLLSGFLLPRAVDSSGAAIGTAIAVVALVGVLVALPTFFEIPLTLLLLQLGAPVGACVA